MKLSLFKIYCLNLYDTGLWHTYLKSSTQKLHLCYNRCIKMIFGYRYSATYSVTRAFLDRNICIYTNTLQDQIMVLTQWVREREDTSRTDWSLSVPGTLRSTECPLQGTEVSQDFLQKHFVFAQHATPARDHCRLLV